jgi:hypothetical protein
MVTAMTDTQTHWPEPDHVTRVLGFMAMRAIPRPQLADAAGLSLDALNRRLRRDVVFSVPELEQVAAALGVDVREFFTPTT